MNIFHNEYCEFEVKKTMGEKKTKETKITTEIINLLYGLKCLKIFLE